MPCMMRGASWSWVAASTPGPATATAHNHPVAVSGPACLPATDIVMPYLATRIKVEERISAEHKALEVGGF